MKTILIKYLLTLSLIFALPMAHTKENIPQGIEKLAPEIRALLQKEMLAIEAAMKEIVFYNANGDTEKVSQVAKQIKESFIMKQSLTSEQKHQLHTLLPSDFIQQDKQFHYYAGMLQHVAEKQKSELISFYFGKLFEACSSCHQAHAKHKFPKFNHAKKPVNHEH